MTALLEQVGEIIGKMNRSEKAQILQWVVSDLGDTFPGITGVLAGTVDRENGKLIGTD